MKFDECLKKTWKLGDDIFISPLDTNSLKVIKVSETETQVFRIEGLMADVLQALGPHSPLGQLMPSTATELLTSSQRKTKFVQLFVELQDLGIVYTTPLEGIRL